MNSKSYSKIYFTIFLFFVFFKLFINPTYAGEISGLLLEKMKEASVMEKIPVIIYLKDQVDLDQMEQVLKMSVPQGERVPVDLRYRTIITALMDIAEQSQPEVIDRMQQFMATEDLSDIQRFWIRNIIVAKATPQTIEEIAKWEDISIIFYDGLLAYDEPVYRGPEEYSSKVGSEAGLKAINAHKLWELGITGQGRIVMGIDTGVNGNNLSFKTRWRGTIPGVRPTWAWHDPAYGTTFPTDSDGHGTHTMGTMCGRYASTNDTIGVAPDAYWIASNSLMGGSPHTSRSIAAFQWAANPDSNINTMNDVPDVISNSWYDSNVELTQCLSTSGGYGPVIEAVEALGVAVVFSAGNNGSSASTITAPKNRARTASDIFCVGALDGNNPSYPIASFSSRGPSKCTTVPDSLKIKPEVSAPGVSVRSASGTSGYATMSGTSMASPHVAGAITLLKQAAPHLTGTEIKYILMKTATDLGTTGEDNTYGWGLIDVYRAYQNLNPILPINEYRIPLSIKNPLGTTMGTINFGGHKDATYCIDNSLGEYELPPLPPGGDFDIRFIDSRTGAGKCFGEGIALDLRSWINTIKADTFIVKFQPGLTGYPVTLSWQNNLSSFFYSAQMRELGGTQVIDMLNSFELQISNDLVDRVQIITSVKPIGSGEPPGIPTLLAPLNNSINQPTTITFEWSEVSGSSNYHLQVSGNSIFTNIIFQDSLLTSPIKQISSLEKGKTYYWRVRAKNLSGNSNWSEIRSLTTGSVPDAPTLIFPENNSIDKFTTLNFVWNKSNTTINYHLQISRNSGFTSLIFNDSTLIDTSKQVSILEKGTIYYWRVRAKNTFGISNWSGVWNFTTDDIPAIATLLAPINGAINQPANPILSWNTALRATTYRLQVSRNSDFSILLIDDSTLTTTSSQLGGLSFNTKYYWRVNSKNIFGNSDWSEIWNFVTGIFIPDEYRIPLIISNAGNSNSKILTFGGHKNATYCIDTGIGENELPPLPPSDVFDVRFIDNRSGSGKCMGEGMMMDLRPWTSQSTLDTFRLKFQSGLPGYPLTLNWPSGLSTYLTFAEIRYGTYTVNMLTSTSISINEPEIILARIYTRVKPRGYNLNVSIDDGWNLVSVPVMVFDNSRLSVFPTSTSEAYAFQGAYVAHSQLIAGLGYWLKFSDSSTITITGDIRQVDTINVQAGWNLIGSITDSVNTASITTIPESIITSQFYGYINGRYEISNVIIPARGYWIKVNQNGKIILSKLLKVSGQSKD